MDRRGFMKMMVGGVAAGAAVRTWPFRVFSFPCDIGEPKDLIIRCSMPLDPLAFPDGYIIDNLLGAALYVPPSRTSTHLWKIQ